MRFFNLSPSLGIEVFSLPHNIKLIKSEDQSLEQYRDWLNTFTYLHNEVLTVALRPYGEAIEMHLTSNPSASVSSKIKALENLSELLRSIPLVTFVGMNNKRIINRLCRYGFEKDKWCGFVEFDGEKHRRFRLIRKKEVLNED